MSQEKNFTRLDFFLSEVVADGEAIVCLFTDADRNVLPLSTGGAGARQPGETASRLLRTIPAESENSICWKKFVVLKSLLSSANLSAVVSHYLLNIDLHLLQIARSRASRDFATVAREAREIGRIAGNLGAIRIGTAAHLLELACQGSDHTATYDLLSDLCRACDEATMTLNGWLASNSSEHGL